MIRDKYVNFNGSRLHYATAGHGTKHLLIFHGFGQDHNAFEYVSRTLAKHYTFYLFDLYFHGASEWAHGEKTLTKHEWRDTLSNFLLENNINRFSVGGFSLGGKFALTALEFFADRIDDVTLIAPDGIKTNVWYSLATYPLILRKLFKSMILEPGRFDKLAEMLHKFGMVDKGLIRFAEYQMGSELKRRRVYYSWVVFRNLKPNLRRIIQQVNSHGINVTVAVGRYDNVIRPDSIQPFIKKLKHHRFHILESGHTGLINQAIPFFIQER